VDIAPQEETIDGVERNDHLESAAASITPLWRRSSKRKRRSWVWSHFNASGGHPTCLECLLTKVARPVSYAASTGVSVLARHLRCSHSIGIDSGVAGGPQQQTLSQTGALDRHDLISPKRHMEILAAAVAWIVDTKQSSRLWRRSHSNSSFTHCAGITSCLVGERYSVPLTTSTQQTGTSEFDIGDRIQGVTTDNGGEMPNAMKELSLLLNEQHPAAVRECWHIRCVCHIMNRAVKDAEACIKTKADKLSSLLKKVRRSNVMKKKFKDVQIILGAKHELDPPGLD
jgi:hypothetical protein